jgi:hypothetical protein
MDEQTGTEDALFEASDMESVANDTTDEQAEEENGSAVEATNEQTDSEEVAKDEPAVESTTQTGDAIDEFLAKKGIDPSEPDAIRKIADMYRNSEKLAYDKSQQTAQLQRQLAQQTAQLQRQLAQQNQQTAVPDQEALNRVRSLEIQIGTKEWKSTHNLSADDEQKMVEFINQPIVDNLGNPKINPLTNTPYTKGMLVNNGVLTLDDVYRLSGCGVKQVDDLKANLRKEIENEMAARQAAKRPSSNATNSTQFGKAEQDDPFLTGLFGE